ncbi:SIMPL domain-containing protein [Candidatus Pacearchaeota archaeon]|nr:SIMPL domain-containing protein [Candidatus Pacearchaeota archaeon]
MTNQINVTAIIITALVVLGVIGAIYFGTNIGRTDNERTISVTGNSEMTVMPDQVVVYLLIQTNNISADVAKDENARISDAVLTELLKIGIERKEIETENFNIYPEYDWINGEQKFKDYSVSNYVKITTTKFDYAGKIVDAAVDNGAIVSYINFELSNAKTNEYKALALTNASQDAKKKAEAIAEGLGNKLGELVSVQTSEWNYGPYRLYDMAMSSDAGSAKEATTNIMPKNLDISGTVTVTYRVK